MPTRAHHWLLLSLLAGSLLLPSVASAQGWLADRSRTEGPGFRVGNLELHPGIGAEIGYDSNVFYEDNDPQSSAIFRATAHLLVSTLTAERREEGEARGGEPGMIAFRGGVNASYYHFFIDNASDNVSGDLGLDLTINPAGTFSFRLHENFARTVRPFTDPAGVADISYGRNTNTVGAEATIRSRADILKGSLGYDLEYEFFDDDVFQFANNLEHVIRGAMSWRFLPQTAVMEETRVYFQSYSDPLAGPANLSNNVRVSSMVGINGAITNTFSAGALVGYAAGFYDDVDDFDGITARVEGRWKPRETTNLVFGYDRNYHSSFIGNYFRQDRGYAKFQLMLAGSFLLGMEASVAYYDSGVALTPTGGMLGTQTERFGTLVKAGLFGEYRFTNWLGVNATLGYTADFTDFVYIDPGPTTLLPDPPASYQKLEAWLGVRVFY